MNRLYLWLQRHPLVADLAIAAPVGLLTLITAGSPIGDRTPLNTALDLVLVFAIVIRRVWFTPAYLLVIGVGLANVVQGMPIGLTPAHLAMPVLLYTAAAAGPNWARRLGLVWIPVAPILAVTAMDLRSSLPESGPAPLSTRVTLAVLLSAPLLAAWVWGDSVRSRRRFYAQLADRADRLERERVALDLVAVAEERARIARELHDVVAHHVSVMVVQADGAGYALTTDPERTREALQTISRTGREALTEMRRLLGVLRTPDSGAAERAPQPGLDSIADLVGQLRGTGLPVDYEVTGRPRPVGAGTGLTAYRVVQESLTNTLKHGGPGVRATVRLVWSRDQLRVEVDDDGNQAGGPARSGGTAGTGGSMPTGEGGHGIIGMRERVRAAGGRLLTGAGVDGGYRVSAMLPLDQQPARPMGDGA